MATKKDFTLTENTDRGKETSKENEDRPLTSDATSAEESKTGFTEVKNAHAAGDGAFGRNEADVQVDDENETAKITDDPAY